MNFLQILLDQRKKFEKDQKNPPWLVVLDIDSTLLDTAFRNRHILHAFKAEITRPENQLLYENKERLKQKNFDFDNECWDICSFISRREKLSEAEEKELFRFWKKHFFSNAALALDQPYAGVRETLQALKVLGFKLVYLTGRDTQNMEAGTRKSFLDHRLPCGPEEVFLFKPDFYMPDPEFKLAACKEIKTLGTVLASFDNIPDNTNLFVQNFPEALHYCLKTIVPEKAQKLSPLAHWADLSSWQI